MGLQETDVAVVVVDVGRHWQAPPEQLAGHLQWERLLVEKAEQVGGVDGVCIVFGLCSFHTGIVQTASQQASRAEYSGNGGWWRGQNNNGIGSLGSLDFSHVD